MSSMLAVKKKAKMKKLIHKNPKKTLEFRMLEKVAFLSKLAEILMHLMLLCYQSLQKLPTQRGRVLFSLQASCWE